MPPRSKFNQCLLVASYIIDILLPISLLLYSPVDSRLGGLTGFFTILVGGIYGYILTLTFPVQNKQAWQHLRCQFWAIITTMCAFIGYWRVGVEQWSVQVVSSLFTGLGSALLVACYRFEKAWLIRAVVSVYGISLFVLGMAWLWEQRPAILPLALLSSVLWAGGWYQLVRQNHSIFRKFFADYYKK